MRFFIVAFVASTIGSVVGIGGGVIIRPMLTTFNIGKGLASFTSAVTVFFMAIVNCALGKKRGDKFRIKSTAFLVIGNIAGAFLGARVLRYTNETAINIAFIFILIAVILLVVFKEKIPPCKVKRVWLQILVGVITGFLSGLFGLGGGPFQMVALLVLFGLKPKDAAMQSIFITLLTTTAALVQYGINGFFDFSISIYTIPGGILGGLTGNLISKKINQNYIPIIFCVTIFVVLINQLYVIFS